MINTSTEVIQGVSTTNVHVELPTVEQRNLFIKIDIESLSILLEIINNLNKLLDIVKEKTVYLFEDLTEYKTKNAETSEKEPLTEFEKLGIKYQEMKSVREHFKELRDEKITEPEQEGGFYDANFISGIKEKMDIA